jgi:hypothetical protein
VVQGIGQVSSRGQTVFGWLGELSWRFVMKFRNAMMAAVAAVAAIALCSASAGAHNVDLVGTLPGPGSQQPGLGTDASVSGHGNVYSGAITWIDASSPTGYFSLPPDHTFTTYCTQLNTDVYFGSHIEFQAVSDLKSLNDIASTNGIASTHSGVTALAIQYAFGTLVNGGKVTTVPEMEAFQCLLWELIYDAPGSWSMSNTSNKFYVIGDGTIQGLAQGYLNDLTANEGSTFNSGLTKASVVGLQAYEFGTDNAVQNQAILVESSSPLLDPPADPPAVPLPASATAGLVLLAINGLRYWTRRRG